MEEQKKNITLKRIVSDIFSMFKGSTGLLIILISLDIVTSLLDGLSMSYFIPLLQVFGLSDSGGALSNQNWFINIILKPFKGIPEKSLLYVFLGIIMIIIAVKNAVIYYKEKRGIWLESSMLTDLRNRIFNKVMDAPLSYFNELKFGHIVNCLQNQTQEVSTAARVTLRLAYEAIMISVFIAFMCILSVKLTMLTMVALVLISVSLYWIQKSIRRISYIFVETNNKFNGVMLEALNNMRLIKAYTAESYERSKFKKAVTEVGQAIYERTRKSLLANPVIELLFVVVLAVILSMGTVFLHDYGKAKTAILVTFLVVLYRLLTIIRDFNMDRIKLSARIGSIHMISDMMADRRVAPLSKGGGIVFRGLKKDIRFEDVKFQYSKEAKLLDGFSLTVDCGQSVGIIGASAAGKSTIVNLLMRFYDVAGGAILVDGINIREFDIASFRARIGFVPQETYLFNTTVEENIRYGRTDFNMEDVINSAKMANVHDFVSQLPDGYKTIIGEKGVKLSGGQRQRIAIARAILHRPDILILDEATSALDVKSEKEIQETIKNIGYRCTKIIIAHRLLTVQDADKIAVLANGKAVEEGKHEELIAKNGVYSKFYYAR